LSARGTKHVAVLKKAHHTPSATARPPLRAFHYNQGYLTDYKFLQQKTRYFATFSQFFDNDAIGILIIKLYLFQQIIEAVVAEKH